MLAERTKFIMAVVLFLGVLVCILGCIGAKVLSDKVEKASSQLPIRSLIITIDETRQEELFAQLQKFADKHAFEIKIGHFFGTGGENFLFEMLRDDVYIHAGNVPSDLRVIYIRFYYKDRAHLAPKQVVDDLYNDLKSFISEIPDATITEEK